MTVPAAPSVPSASTAPPASVEPASPEADAGRSARVGLAVFALLVLGAAGWFLLNGGSDSGGLQLVIHEDPQDEGDLYVASPGAELRDLEPVVERVGSASPVVIDGRADLELISAWSSERNEIYDPDDPSAREVIRLSGEQSLSLEEHDDRVFGVAATYADNGDSECFIGSDAAALERVVRADTCHFTDDKSRVIGVDWDADGENSVGVFSLEGEELFRASSDAAWAVSPDGKRLATVEDGRDTELVLHRVDDGTEVMTDVSAEWISPVGFVGEDLWVMTRAGLETELFVVDPTGESTSLVSDESFGWAEIIGAGDVAVFQTDGAAYLFNTSTGEEFHRVDGDLVQVVSDPQDSSAWAAFAWDDNDIEVFVGRGANAPREVASHRLDNPVPEWVWFGNDGVVVYSLYGWDGEGILALSRNGETEEVSDRSAYLVWADPSGDRLVFTEYDDGSRLLLYDSGERVRELDFADSLGSIVASGSTLYYSATDRGDSEVRSVEMVGDSRPVVLFEDASLVGIRGGGERAEVAWLTGD
ncbi:MAG: hypothetical protein RIB98_14785 [Acidimicrobiales bacterium]